LALPIPEEVTVIAVSTSGGCHAFYVSNALAVLSIFTYVSDALSARTWAYVEKRKSRIKIAYSKLIGWYYSRQT
jgi:hypothetical protein